MAAVCGSVRAGSLRSGALGGLVRVCSADRVRRTTLKRSCYVAVLEQDTAVLKFLLFHT